MNWYKLFYFVSIADGIREALNTLAIIGCVAGGVLLFILFVGSNMMDDFSAKDLALVASTKKTCRRALRWIIPVSIFAFLLSVLIPSKRDGLLILAGGAVGTYIAGDSSIKALPKEATELLREKIREEVKEIRAGNTGNDLKDTLKEKSKEELIKIVNDLRKN